MNRTLINKVLSISGGLTILTGLFLVVHFKSHFAVAVHQIAGFIMLIFGVRHMWINRAALNKAFASKRFMALMFVLFIISVVIMVVTGEFEQHPQ